MFADEDYWERADWRLLQNGAVNLFHDPALLAEACAALGVLGYVSTEISCRDGTARFQQQFSDLLRWEDQFGYAPWSGNLNALNDGIMDYPFGASARSALILNGFHALADADAGYAHGLLDIFETAARDHLLFGRTLVVLIQTDDRDYACPNIGGRAANWNSREWRARRD